MYGKPYEFGVDQDQLNEEGEKSQVGLGILPLSYV